MHCRDIVMQYAELIGLNKTIRYKFKVKWANMECFFFVVKIRKIDLSVLSKVCKIELDLNPSL